MIIIIEHNYAVVKKQKKINEAFSNHNKLLEF